VNSNLKKKADMADKSMDVKTSVRWTLGWVPVLLVLSFSAWITDTISLGGPYAIIPLAAWIGATYGGKGFWAVLLGGLLLPLGLYLGPYSLGLHLDVYLVALLACRMAASPRPLEDWVPRFDSKKLRVTAFVILPLTVVFYAGKLIGDLPVRLGSDLYGLLMLWLFAVGTAGRRATPMMIGLAVASVIGMALDMCGWPPQADVILEARRAYLPVLGLSDLKHMGVDYGLNSPQGCLTGAGYFWSGRFIRRLWENGHGVLPSPWRACGWLSLASVFVLSNWDYFLFAKVLDWPRYEAFNVMGSPLALLLVGLMAGVLLGRYGIGLMVGLVVLFWGLNGLVLSGFDFARPHIVFRLQEIVYTVGFGALGVRLRDIALDEETFLFSRRWVWYTLLLGAVVFSVLIEKSPLSEKLILLGVCVLVVGLAALSRYLRNRFAAWQAEGHGGWVSLLGVITLASLAWQRAGEITETGRAVHKMLRNIAAVPMRDLAHEVDGDMIFPMFFILIYVWFFLTALQALIKHLPALIEDLRRVWIGLRSLFKWNGKIRVEFTPQKDADQVRAGGVINRLVRSSSYLRCGLLVLTIALPLTLLIIDAYPRHGLWAEVKDFYEDNIQAPPMIRQIPLECRGDSANPYLWQAAMEYIGDKPLVEADPCGYSGKIETGWFISGDKPLQCTQLTFYIRQQLNESSLQVYTNKKERRMGLIWVEINSNHGPKKRITQHIYTRAAALAVQAEGSNPK
jgi:hypothetical protein